MVSHRRLATKMQPISAVIGGEMSPATVCSILFVELLMMLYHQYQSILVAYTAD